MIFCVFHGFSQQSDTISITGSLKEKADVKIQEAIIQLLKAKDSSVVRTEFSDSDGNFFFHGISASDYIISVNAYGYKNFKSDAMRIDKAVVLGPFILEASVTQLKEVAVITRKPFIERENGKVILNVENNISAAGSSVFEVIEKAPGVMVTNNDNIIYKGKGGVQVQIDGKLTPMTGSDLANYLRGMPASSIEKIEFIANPSSKYDAAGTSIINIRLKKDKRMGSNGSFTGMLGQGVYPKANAGVVVNHRDKKFSLFGNYNYGYRKGFNDLRLTRKFYRNDSLLGAYDQKNYIIFPFKNHVARVGADYSIDKNNTIGVVLSGVDNRFNPTGDNRSDVLNGNNEVISRFGTTNRSSDHWYNYSGNLNYKLNFDSLTGELTTDFDYAHFGNNTTQNFTTRYYDLSGNESVNPFLLHGDLNGSLDIYSAKADLSKRYRSGLRFEAGAKASYVVADNNLKFFDRSNNQNIFDTTKSNHFIYKEKINAAYFNFSKEAGKWNLQGGLRAEYTNVSGSQLIYNVTNDTNYIQLFPSALVSYKVSERHALELNYSRRINRPSYEQLNPFKYYLDPTTYKEGNPYLKPQTTHSWELSHIFKQKIFTTLSYARTMNNITEIIAPSDKQQTVTIQTNRNLTSVDIYALNFSMPVEITKWWFTQNDLGVYYNLYSGSIANTTIKQRGNLAFNINSSNTFNFGKGFSAELSGNYRAKEIYAYETVSPIWFVTAGVQYKFKDNKGSVKLNATDIFFTNKVSALAEFTGYRENFMVTRETRVVSLTCTYKFGNSNVNVKRKSGGAEDIKQRAGKNG